MPFTKFVEIGRVAYISGGKNEGKIVTIVDVIDQKRALVDGPTAGIKRQPMAFKNMQLTSLRMKMPMKAGERFVSNKWKTEEIDKKWSETKWYKGLAAKNTKRNLTDFERYQVMRIKQKRNRLINRMVIKLKRQEKYEKKKQSGGLKEKRVAAKKEKKGAEKKPAAAKKPAPKKEKKTVEKKAEK